MFSRTNPNRELAIQQSIFGTRELPAPTLKERLAAVFKLRKTKPQNVMPQTDVPMGETIRNALFSDIPELASEIPIIINPATQKNLPETFIALSLVPKDPDAVQIELFMENETEARYKLLGITSEIERGKSPQILAEGITLKADRLVIHTPTMPGKKCVVAHVKPGRKMQLLL